MMTNHLKAFIEQWKHILWGGSKEEFQKVTVCYKALMIKLRERENNHEHNELRENSTDFMRNQSSDNFQNRDLSKNFDQNAFNRIYEENRMEDIHDQGYEKWMKENQATSDDIIHDTSLTRFLTIVFQQNNNI